MSYIAQARTIYSLMQDVDGNNYFLPAIQREFVWASAKVEALFDSLLRGYPIGTMLFWHVRRPIIHDFQFYDLVRDYDVRKPHNIKANLSARDECIGILDGQQRITALNIGLLGSYTEKLPRMWWKHPDSFPRKCLYINLLFNPASDDQEQAFQVKFLTEVQAKEGTESGKAFWLRVGDILKIKTRDALREFRRSTPYRESDAFENNLDALYTTIHERANIIYFLAQTDDLDEVLRIFVRLNMGGDPLSYSDLLLSLATATWKTHDAREQVYELVDYLNRDCGQTFAFTKDFVLKALLVLSDQDVRFRAENIRKKKQLEDIWELVRSSLKVTGRLTTGFGFNDRTLTAPNAVIPIAYYLFKRNFGDAFLTSSSHAQDREAVRLWLLKILLGKVFRGQTDQILTTIRGVIRRMVQGGSQGIMFPADEINNELRLRFTQEDIQDLISETNYGDPLAFSILALLYPHLNYEVSQFHMDHVHPASQFTKSNLAAAGMGEDDVVFALGHFNRLPNLQLLAGSVNAAKTSKPLEDWLDSQPDPGWYRATSYIPDIDLSLKNFRSFYEAREHLVVAELEKKLG